MIYYFYPDIFKMKTSISSSFQYMFDFGYITLLHVVPMENPIKFDTVKSAWSIVYILMGHRLLFPKKKSILSLKINFCLNK